MRVSSVHRTLGVNKLENLTCIVILELDSGGGELLVGLGTFRFNLKFDDGDGPNLCRVKK